LGASSERVRETYKLVGARYMRRDFARMKEREGTFPSPPSYEGKRKGSWKRPPKTKCILSARYLNSNQEIPY